MLTNERAVAVVLRQQRAFVEGQAERGSMRAQCIVRDDGTLDQIRALGLHALIDVLAEVAVGPPVESAVLHRGHVVRHQVAADLVALVDGGP